MTATELRDICDHGTDAQIDAAASWLAWKMRGCPLTPAAHLNARGEAEWLTRLGAAIRRVMPHCEGDQEAAGVDSGESGATPGQCIDDDYRSPPLKVVGTARVRFRLAHGIEDRPDAAHLASMAEGQARLRGQR